MNAYLDAANMFGAGVDALFGGNQTSLSLVPIADIQVKAQIRKDFEDTDNTIQELSESIKQRGVLQPILLRPAPNGVGYELVAGERRLRASKLAGLSVIPAHIKEMSDEEADDAQLAENIQRKNLTQIEEAEKIQRDLDKLGSVEAVLAKHHKSRAWLSKMLGLLNLSEQAKRLVNENISADVEVINLVKTIEKHDDAAAKQLVDDLKNTRGQSDARAKAKAVKNAIKPGKNAEKTEPNKFQAAFHADLEKWIAKLEAQLSQNEQSLDEILAQYVDDEVAQLTQILQPYFEHGQHEPSLSMYVAEQYRQHHFSETGLGRLALYAFLQGAEKRSVLDLKSLLMLI